MNRLALKFLNADGRGEYSRFAWPPPREDGKPGQWVKAEGELIPCRNGIHACTLDQALDWLDARAYMIELDGRIIGIGDKLVARRGRLIRHLNRWDDKTIRLFAADCAEHVLPLYESKVPLDDRPRQAIEAARALARGEIDADAADAAASAAAYVSAHDAAVFAARAAGSPDAERTWQGNRLAHYLGLTAKEKKAVSS